MVQGRFVVYGGKILQLGLCADTWSVCEVILLPCVVMYVLLFVWDVSMLRE